MSAGRQITSRRAPRAATTFYFNYGEASRAPTVIELGCANPAAPCGLPNEFAGDPDLQQVIARTAELGVRGAMGDQALLWSADTFRTMSSNDIQFVATAANSGYFENVGSTRRQGLDLALGGRHGGLHWQMIYSLVDATFQSSFTVNAPSNSSADAAGNILVRPGDRIPLIPRHTGRLILDYALSARWDVGGNLVAASGSYLHGNENNSNQAGRTNAAGLLVAYHDRSDGGLLVTLLEIAFASGVGLDIAVSALGVTISPPPCCPKSDNTRSMSATLRTSAAITTIPIRGATVSITRRKATFGTISGTCRTATRRSPGATWLR